MNFVGPRGRGGQLLAPNHNRPGNEPLKRGMAEPHDLASLSECRPRVGIAHEEQVSYPMVTRSIDGICIGDMQSLATSALVLERMNHHLASRSSIFDPGGRREERA